MLSSLIKSTLAHPLKRSISTWKPNVPKHKIIIDKQSYRLAHPVWSLKDAEVVEMTHVKPQNVRDWIAYGVMKCLRICFDISTGYKTGKMNEILYLRRMIFLETVAGVPGMVGGMARHFRSLRAMIHDGGWIHHLLEEAENERMHLFTFLKLRNPGIIFRLAVLVAQAIFILGYSSVYMISPRYAHRFVGYLEEEAVKTYTNCLKDLDEGKLPTWVNLKAFEEAIKYWGLPADATFRDVLVAIRADEAMHREFNHHLANIHPDTPLPKHNYVVVENTVGESLKDDGNFSK